MKNTNYNTNKTFTVNGKTFDYKTEKMLFAELAKNANLEQKEMLESVLAKWGNNKNFMNGLGDVILDKAYSQIKSKIENFADADGQPLKIIEFSKTALAWGARINVTHEANGETSKEFFDLQFQILRDYGNDSDFKDDRYLTAFDLTPNNTYVFGLTTKIQNYETSGYTYETKAGMLIEKDEKDNATREKLLKQRVIIKDVFTEIAKETVEYVEKSSNITNDIVEFYLNSDAYGKLESAIRRLTDQEFKIEEEKFFADFLKNGILINKDNFETDFWNNTKIKGCSERLPEYTYSDNRVVKFSIDNWDDNKSTAVLTINSKMVGYDEHESKYRCDREDLKTAILAFRDWTLRKNKKTNEEN